MASKPKPKQKANDPQRQAGSSRLNNVTERIERMYADDYFKIDNMETKHDGFFVNRGKLEHIEPTISHNQQPRKRRHKDLAKGHGGSDDRNDGNKQVKLGVKGRKESSSMNKNPTSQSLTAAVTDVKVQAFPTNASAVSFPSKNNIDGTTSAQDPAELYAIRQGKNIDLQNVPLIPGIEGSDFDAKTDLLDETIVELKTIVDEFQPPAKEVHDPDSSSQAVKRRLPHEIKLMLAKIARLTEDIYGKMPKHVLLRLMDIVGHLMQLSTLKKHLKVMAESGLSARLKKDEQVRKIRQEVEEMVKLWIPFMKYKVEKLNASSSYFRESGPAEKEDLIRKHSMDDALEDKICSLYELYAERIEENSGLQVKVLYEELAALWPSGFMDTHGIRYAIHRAKERRRLPSNLMKSEHHSQAWLRKADKGEDVEKAHYVPDSGSVIRISYDGNGYQSPDPRNNSESKNQREPVGQARPIKREKGLKGKNVVLSEHKPDTEKHLYINPDPKHNSATKYQAVRANQVVPSEEDDKAVQSKTNVLKVKDEKNVVTIDCISNIKAVNYRDNESLYPKPSPEKNLEEHQHEDADLTQPGKKHKVQRQRKLRKVVHGSREIKVDDAASRNDVTQIENKPLFHKPCPRKHQVTKNCFDQARPKQSHSMFMKERDITDDSDSDVEILDSATFYRAGNPGPFMTSKKFHKSVIEDDNIKLLGRTNPQFDFRRQVMNVLRKPYDKQESNGLREAFMAGSYVKFHPDLVKKLATHRYEKGKCLAILRGFFFWLENLTREGSFKPWKDRECLRVDPTLP